MKLLFVIDNLGTGGAQRQMVNLAIGLTTRGHQVRIFCYSPGDKLAQPLRDAGVSIAWHEKHSRYSLDVIFALYNSIVSEHFDILLSFLSTPNFYSLIAGRLAKGRKLPVIVSERFCDLPEGMSLMERLVRQTYRLADHVVVNSHHQMANFAQKYPFLHNRISRIDNGYDLTTFVPPTIEPDNQPMRILCIASVSPYKNGLCVVEALNILHKKQPKMFCVTWIGHRMMMGERLIYLREMESKIEKYGLGEYWQWLDPRTDIVKQMHQHDVLVHASYGEGSPNVVCEALSCGRPVILSNTLDHPRLVEDGQNGYLFDWRDPSALAEKIRLFSELSHEERSNLGKKGRQFAEAHLSMGRYLDEYERLFRGLLNKKPQ
jgi:GalNAc-alpha-(1->4)-GalNAc-alpha-(1->3)-diNAcBac-PP-undecaprenol alpha-1,4-N-acetyl-D-galactosaminyltransferase